MKSDSPSGTARLIALATIMHPDLAPAGAARCCELLLRQRPGLLAFVRSRVGRWLGARLERALLPGVVTHWLSRKRKIDRLARAAHRDGFTQLVILGAGLDTLAYRLAEEGLFTRILAADHPATLASLPSLESRVERCPIDLASEAPLPALSSLPTLVVAEGLLMYLPIEAVQRLLRQLARLPVPRVRLVASWMLGVEGRAIGFSEQSTLVKSWLHWRGEPMLWATAPELLRALLQQLGWHQVQITRFGLESEQLAIADSPPAS